MGGWLGRPRRSGAARRATHSRRFSTAGCRGCAARAPTTGSPACGWGSKGSKELLTNLGVSWRGGTVAGCVCKSGDEGPKGFGRLALGPGRLNERDSLLRGARLGSRLGSAYGERGSATCKLVELAGKQSELQAKFLKAGCRLAPARWAVWCGTAAAAP